MRFPKLRNLAISVGFLGEYSGRAISTGSGNCDSDSWMCAAELTEEMSRNKTVMFKGHATSF